MGELMERDEWEEQILKQMVEMFRQLGMDVDEDDLSRMMSQIQTKFEDMGIDPEKLSKGEFKFNVHGDFGNLGEALALSLIHISEPTRLLSIW